MSRLHLELWSSGSVHIIKLNRTKLSVNYSHYCSSGWRIHLIDDAKKGVALMQCDHLITWSLNTHNGHPIHTIWASMVNSVSKLDICMMTSSKWKHFPRYWPFVRGIHRSPVNSPHKGQWRGTLMFSLNCVWINGWVNNGETGDLRRYRAHYDVTVMDHRYTCGKGGGVSKTHPNS